MKHYSITTTQKTMTREADRVELSSNGVLTVKKGDETEYFSMANIISWKEIPAFVEPEPLEPVELSESP